jgi:Tol biopolymer transport system component
MLLAPLLAAAALERIAFWSDRAGDPDVFTMGIDGSDVRNLGTRDWGDKRASWSPDGTRIAYDSWHAGHTEFDIWIMDANGSGKRQLTTSPLRDTMPVWSPTGEWIAFTRKRARSQMEDVWLIRPDGTGEHRFVRGAAGGGWSPGGRRYVYSFGGDLYVGRKRLTHTRAYEAAGAGSWSPDGRRILLTRWPVGAFGDIYVYDLRTGKARRLTSSRADDGDASWSPDGKQVLFDTTRDGNREVYVMNADGTGLRNVSRNPAEDWADTWR